MWKQTLTDAGIPYQSACVHIIVRVAPTAVLVDGRSYGHVPWCLNNNLASERIAVVVQIRSRGIRAAVQVVVEASVQAGFQAPFAFPVTSEGKAQALTHVSASCGILYRSGISTSVQVAYSIGIAN